MKLKKNTQTTDPGVTPAKEPPSREPADEGRNSDEIIGMEEAIAQLKTTRPTFYRWLRAGKFRGMKTGRQWRFYKSDIEAFLHGEGPRIALAAPIAPLLDLLRAAYAPLDHKAISPRGQTELEQAAYLTLGTALRMRATDIHIHGCTTGQAVIRMRTDGVLHSVAQFDSRLLAPFIEQWRVLTNADLSVKPISQDGHAMLSINDEPFDLRSSFVQTALGDAVTMRVIPRAEPGDFSLEALDMSPEAKQRLTDGLGESTGLIVITGPIGSGKTTTLCAALMHVASPEIKVMTIEDPVEVLLENVVQVPVRPALGMTFAEALVRVVRSDPDVIMVGEVRDHETLEICCKAAVAGHLVLTSLFQPTAVRALQIMGELINDPGMAFLGNIVRVVVAQRLLRKLCPTCAAPRKVPRELAEEAKRHALEGGVDWDALPKYFRMASGCSHCGNTGAYGRLAVNEALTITPAIREAFRNGASLKDIERLAVKEGMITLMAQGIRLAASGIVALEEVFRVLR